MNAENEWMSDPDDDMSAEKSVMPEGGESPQKRVRYSIDAAKCKGCTICARKCPSGAIAGAVRQPHAIDGAKCVYCGQCLAACRFGAIELQA
mgnify:CR=1 FL=1